MRLALALVLICSPVAAQDTQPEGPRPDRVQISPGVVDAEVGQTIRFTATAYDANGGVIAAKPTAWFGAPFDVGAADEEGLVTVFAPGELKVGAIVNGKTGWATIRIKPQQVSLGRHRAARRAAGAGSGRAARGAHVHQGRHPARGRGGGLEVGVAVGGDRGCGRRRHGRRAGRATIRATSEQGTATSVVTVAANTVPALAIEPRSRMRGPAMSCDFRREAADARCRRCSGRSTAPGPRSTPMAGSSRSARAPSSSRPRTARVSATSSVVVGARNVQRALELVGRTPAEDFQTLEQWTFGDYLYATSALSGKLWVYDITSPVGADESRRAQLRRAHPERHQRVGRRQDWRAHAARARRTARTASSSSTRPIRRIRRCSPSTPRPCRAACTARSSTATTST